MKTAIFRCDATIEMGSGHVMRCLSLAGFLQEKLWDCVFSVSEGTEKIVPALLDSGYRVTGPKGPFFDKKSDIIVIDGYGFSAKDEDFYLQFSKKVIVIDDLANRRHNCAILVDQTYGRKKTDYKSLIPSGAVLLCGSEYAILRPDFLSLRESSLQARRAGNGKIQKILVSLGGTDPENVTARVIEGIYRSGLIIDVVIGSSTKKINELSAQIESLQAKGIHITLHRDIKNMSRLMKDADLAIGAGGTTSWERCCLGLPAILIETADNQSFVAKRLHDSGAVSNLGWHEDVTSEKISAALLNLMENPDAVDKMSRRSAEICDGLGASRILQVIDCMDVTIRHADISDAKNIYEWRNSDEVRKFSAQSVFIAYESHLEWLEKTIADPDRDLMVFERYSNSFGVLRFDYEGDAATISIYLDPAFIGQGMGSVLIQKAEAWIVANRPDIRRIRARIMAENYRSQKSFLKAGYKPCGGEYFELELG